MFDSSWGITLKNYWYSGLETAWSLDIPLIMLGVFGLFCLVIMYIIRTKANKPTITKAWSSVYWSGLLTTGVAVFTALCLMRFSCVFAKQVCQMGFLAGLLLMAVPTIWAFAKLCTLGKQKAWHALGVVVTEAEQGKQFKKFKHYSWVLWLWSLTLAIPFAVFIIPNKSKHLISIVLDNSGSMQNYLAQCTQAFGAALLPTQQSADYVFTTLDYIKNENLLQDAYDKVEATQQARGIQSEKDQARQVITSYYNEIVNQKSAHSLSTNTAIYSDAQSLFNAFVQTDISSNGSPIYEGIWQNYLTSRNVAPNGSYISKKMIVITDGVDISYLVLDDADIKDLQLRKDIFQQLGAVGQTASDFYDAIYTINYGEYSNEILFRDCAGSIDEIYDGMDGQSYFDAFRSILPEMYFDKLFLYILIGLSILQVLILLIVKTSKI